MDRIKLLHIYRKLECYINKDNTGKDCSNINVDDCIKKLLPMLKKYLDTNEPATDEIIDELAEQSWEEHDYAVIMNKKYDAGIYIVGFEDGFRCKEKMILN